MKIKFEGILEIPDEDVDSHCDVDHALIRKIEEGFETGSTENGAAEEILSFLNISWHVQN